MLERLKVGIEPTTIDGVRAYIVTPKDIAPEIQTVIASSWAAG
jgi:monoterpene epsilon-lactone hydrolase